MRLIFWLGLAVAVVMFISIIEMSRKNALDRQGFFIGASLSLGLAVFSLLPEMLRSITFALGLDYTYVFTSTIGIFGLLALNIYALAKISRLRRDMNDLSQEVALNAEERTPS